jgi:multidrug resistance efflux pump
MVFRLRKVEKRIPPTEVPLRAPRRDRTSWIPLVVVAFIILVALGWWATAKYYEKRIYGKGLINMTVVSITAPERGYLASLSCNPDMMVAEGQTLAILRQPAATTATLVLEQAVERAENRLKLAESGADVGIADLAPHEKDVIQAEHDLQIAQQHLAFAQKTLEAVNQTLVIATDECEQAKRLYELDAITFGEYQTLLDRKRAQETELAKARAALREARIDSQAAEKRRSLARQLQANANVSIASRRDLQIAILKNDIQELEARLDLERAKTSEIVVSAPIAGKIGTIYRQPNEFLEAGDVFAELFDIANPWVDAYVPQKRLPQLAIGAPVRITIVAYPDSTYGGRIVHIAPRTTVLPKLIQPKYYQPVPVIRAKIQFEELPPVPLLPDMEVRVRIL